MGAADTHLHKLDVVQRTAEGIGRFQVASLQSKREVAAISLTFKLLEGRGRDVLKNFVPTVIDHSKGSKRCRSPRHAACGLQLESRNNVGSLDAYKRSYLGCVHHVWSKLPQDVLMIGEKNVRSKITKRCKLHLMGKQPKCRAAGKRVKLISRK